jgi:hypothetical protein
MTDLQPVTWKDGWLIAVFNEGIKFSYRLK